MKTRLLLLLSTICLSAEEPRPVYPESTESKVRETLSRVAVPKGEFKDTPLADAVKLLRMKLAAAGDDVRGITILSNDPLVNLQRIDLEWAGGSVMDLIRRIAEKSGAMVSLEGRSIEFRRKDFYVMPQRQPGAEENIAVRRRLESRMIPRVEFQDITLAEAVDFLRMRDAEIDSLQPAKRDIIVITDPTLHTARLNVYVLNVSTWNALHLLAEKAGASVIVSGSLVEIRPKGMAVFPEVFLPPQGKALKEAGKLKLQVRWEGITLQEAVDHLNMRVYESPDENLQLRIVLASTADPETPVPPLRIRDVPMPVLIHHLAILTKTRVRSGERDIVIGK